MKTRENSRKFSKKWEELLICNFYMVTWAWPPLVPETLKKGSNTALKMYATCMAKTKKELYLKCMIDVEDP